MQQLRENLRSLPPAAKAQALERLKAQQAVVGKVVKTPEAVELESKGYEPWLKALGPRTFSRPFAFFHHEFWGWYWPVRMKLLRGETLEPAEMAMLLMWGRGMGKSSHVEWACIAEGALGEGLTTEPGFVGYVCDTEALAKGHIQSIRNRLDSPEIAHYYPGLSNPRVDRHGYQTAWRQDFLATSSHWGIIPIGLEEGVRGGRLFDLRFTMFVFDDIDSRKDSPAAVEKKQKIIAHEILPAGTPDTLKLVPQNLIHENGFVNQVYTRRSDILSERQESGPYPAFDDLELELDETSAGRKWKIRKAVPTWPSIDVRAASVFLADSGRAAFLAEYQHDFESNKEGRVLRNYDDRLMVIRKSDFEGVYGTREVPANWAKRVFHDWARTKTAYHANVAGKLTVSNQNTKLPGKLFLFDLKSFDAGTQADDVGLWMVESISPFVPDLGSTPLRFTAQTWRELIEASLSRQGLEQFVSDTTQLINARRDTLAGVLPKYVSRVLPEYHYNSFVGSHEQANDALAVYRRVYGLPFTPVNPGQTGGLEWIDHFMLADKQTEHPFFEDELLEDGTWKLGCPGMFIIVEDDKYPYPQVATPDALHDSDLCRYQFNNWRMRAPKLTEGGMMEYGPMKMNDDFGTGCFVGETLVITEAGEREIKDIQPGERVLTRAGWCEVEVARQTSPAAEVYEVELSDGRTLCGTADHPIYVCDEGWKLLHTLKRDDILYSWQNVRQSISTASASTAIPNQRIGRTPSTSSRTFTHDARAFSRSMLRFGRPLTGLCLKAWRFITRTATPTTTTLATSASSAGANTHGFTRGSAPDRPNDLPNSSGRLNRLHGLLGCGLPRARRRCGRTHASQCQSFPSVRAIVIFAALNISTSLRAVGSALTAALCGNVRALSFRLSPVHALPVASPSTPCRTSTRSIAATHAALGWGAGLTTRSAPANDAQRPSARIESARSSAANPVVVRLRRRGCTPVYNLQVKSHPEYFASGVLVHNCQMAFVNGPPAATPLTHYEQVIEATPKHLRPEELQKESPYEEGLLAHQEMSALLARRFAEQKITPRFTQFDEFGEPIG